MGGGGDFPQGTDERRTFSFQPKDRTGDLLVHAFLLDLIYLAVGAGLFLYSFQVARRRGLLLQVGE